jgi:prepilin-type processing-associated H-X9-DG protein
MIGVAEGTPSLAKEILSMSHRRAFTLFDLIVLAAGGVLGFGVLVPYVGKLQQRSARVSSQNNLKSIALGCQTYHDVNGAFPSGIDAHGFSASAHILPYIEQNNVFQLIDFSKAFDGGGGTADARKAAIKAFLNPADPIRSVNAEWGATNYLYSAGSKADLVDNNGVFFRDSKVTLPEITFADGSTYTLMCGETLKGDGGAKAVDVHRQHVAYKKEALGKLTDDSGVRDFQDGRNIAGDRGASWMDGRFLQGTFTTTRILNDDKPDVDCGGVGGLSGLRSLSDSVNVAMCDGSVRSIDKKITFKIWQALATRNGGEEIPNF